MHRYSLRRKVDFLAVCAKNRIPTLSVVMCRHVSSGWITIHRQYPYVIRRASAAYAKPLRVTAVEPQPATPWMTKREAAAYARVSVGTLDRAIRAGALRYARVGFGTLDSGGGRVLLRSEWIDAWLEHREPGTQRGEVR